MYAKCGVSISYIKRDMDSHFRNINHVFTCHILLVREKSRLLFDISFNNIVCTVLELLPYL